MGTPALPDLGKHCSVSECHQIDFLPFTCDSCHKVFCLEHRTYGSHSCPDANAQDITVLVCPVCAKSIRSVPGEDANVTWERHMQTNCDPTNYVKATKKPRCPVPGCKELLFFSNKVQCRSCHRDICLKHRFGQDHNCEAFRKADTNKRSLASSFGNMFLGSFKEKTPVGAGSNDRSKRAANEASTSQSGSFTGALTGLQLAATSMRSSMEAGMSKLSATTNDLMNNVVGSASRRQTPVFQTPTAAPRGHGSQSEACPQCHAQFSSVNQLIQHVESMHESASPLELLDVCPKCGEKFRDPITLVNHAERDHGGRS